MSHIHKTKPIFSRVSLRVERGGLFQSIRVSAAAVSSVDIKLCCYIRAFVCLFVFTREILRREIRRETEDFIAF